MVQLDLIYFRIFLHKLIGIGSTMWVRFYLPELDVPSKLLN